MTENKWEYKGRNFNLIDNDYSDRPEKKELFDIIDNGQKEKLRELFDVGLERNYDRYKKYLFESNFFMFRDLELHIVESVNCLIIGAFIASITNTNLILERAVKLALIQYETGIYPDYNDEKILEQYILADKRYSGKNLGQNIQKCLKYKILNKEEYSELQAYKNKFRDGFSHFTPRNILKGETRQINISSMNNFMEQYIKTPDFQSSEVASFARKNAEPHLNYILEIINHLQYKVLEKFKKEIKNSYSEG